MRRRHNRRSAAAAFSTLLVLTSLAACGSDAADPAADPAARTTASPSDTSTSEPSPKADGKSVSGIAASPADPHAALPRTADLPPAGPVVIAVGVQVGIPTGWHLDQHSEGNVTLAAPDGSAWVSVKAHDAPSGYTATAARSDELARAAQQFAKVEVGDTDLMPRQVLGSVEASAASAVWRGEYASTARRGERLEALLEVFLTTDGRLVVFETHNPPDAFDRYRPAYQAVVSSIGAYARPTGSGTHRIGTAVELAGGHHDTVAVTALQGPYAPGPSTPQGYVRALVQIVAHAGSSDLFSPNAFSIAVITDRGRYPSTVDSVDLIPHDAYFGNPLLPSPTGNRDAQGWVAVAYPEGATISEVVWDDGTNELSWTVA